MHQGIKILYMGSVLFSAYLPLCTMNLIELPKDVIFSIAHLLINEEDEPFDYYNCGPEKNTHTCTTFKLLKEYKKNITADYANLINTCKHMYSLLNLENQFPTHLNWDVFIKSMHGYTFNDEGLLKITSSDANVTEKYSFEFFSFGRYIKWKLTCDFFQRSSRKAISKNALLSQSFIDRQSALWDVLDFAKRNSVLQTVLIQSFANRVHSDNDCKYIEFTFVGSFDWLKKGVPHAFVKKYFLQMHDMNKA